MNFKASINRAKNGTLLLNYRDTIAVRTETVFALIHRSNIGDACLWLTKIEGSRCLVGRRPLGTADGHARRIRGLRYRLCNDHPGTACKIRHSGRTSPSRLQPRLDYHVDPVLFHRLLHRHQAEARRHHLDRCRTWPFCLLAGKLTGKRTIWIDSVANVEKLSLSGKLAGHIATLWLTQWQHLSRPDGPHYAGAVL